MPSKAPVQTKELEPYVKLTLPELETKLSELLRREVSGEENAHLKRQERVVRVAMRERKVAIKQQVMDFEESNNRHLLVYESTDGYCKIAGHSTLFFALKIAERLHRRCKVLPDNDTYYQSQDGVISIRGLDVLAEQLKAIKMEVDVELSREELHFFKLPRVYSETEIEKLRDFSKQDLERIQAIILPSSPMPLLYRDILELNRLIYYCCRDISDKIVKETLGERLILQADTVLQNYLNYGGFEQSTTKARQELQENMARLEMRVAAKVRTMRAQNMMTLWLNTRRLRNQMANMENLKILRSQKIGQILTKVVDIEKAVEREYRKLATEYERALAEAK